MDICTLPSNFHPCELSFELVNRTKQAFMVPFIAFLSMFHNEKILSLQSRGGWWFNIPVWKIHLSFISLQYKTTQLVSLWCSRQYFEWRSIQSGWNKLIVELFLIAANLLINVHLSENKPLPRKWGWATCYNKVKWCGWWDWWCLYFGLVELFQLNASGLHPKYIRKAAN